MTERPVIVVSNDDGVNARGHLALREALKEIADVYSIAPELEQSAKSHAITLHSPLRFRDVQERVWAVDGTPADCVYVALFLKDLLPRPPDLVVSGINHGLNLGGDIYYSGTVAAAREGALRGIPSIAFSNAGWKMEEAAVMARDFCARMLAQKPLPDRSTLINVNFPAAKPKGVRVVRLGLRIYSDGIELRHDPRGRSYLWIGGPSDVEHRAMPGSDTEAIDEGYASVTPLSLQGTDLDHFEYAKYVASVNEMLR